MSCDSFLSACDAAAVGGGAPAAGWAGAGGCCVAVAGAGAGAAGVPDGPAPEAAAPLAPPARGGNAEVISPRSAAQQSRRRLAIAQACSQTREHTRVGRM